VSSRRAGWASLLLVALPLLPLPEPIAAQAEFLTPAAGGQGGSDFSLSCNANEVMVGVTGRAGWVVDRLAALCQAVDSNGAPAGATRQTAAAGGTGGNAFTLRCPAGQAVAGIQGRAGQMVDRIQVSCRRVTGGTTTGAVTWIAAAGGNGGSAFGAHPCTGDRPAKSLVGRAGSAIDRIRLGCALPAAGTVATQKQEFCFGALGAGCGGAQHGVPVLALCANGRCLINAGSWAHDECCWRNPDGYVCREGPLDLVANQAASACRADLDRAVAHLAGGLNWSRPVNFQRANTTGVVVHAEYCAPDGTVLKRQDARYCCSRMARPVQVPADLPRLAEQAVAIPLDPELGICWRP
jgi:hypothetical protein